MFPFIWEFMGSYGFLRLESIDTIYDLNFKKISKKKVFKVNQNENIFTFRKVGICQIGYKPGSVI